MKVLTKVFKWVATGSLSCLLAACYGVMYSTKNVMVTVLDGDGDPISGLSVHVLEDGQDTSIYETTDLNGQFYYGGLTPYPVENIELTFTDIDGADNGGDFKEETLSLNVSGSGDLEQQITLEEK